MIKSRFDHQSFFDWDFGATYINFLKLKKVSIKEVKRNIFVIIEINHNYIPDIKIRIPNLKNLRRLKNSIIL